LAKLPKNKFPKIKANDFLGEISCGNVYFFFLNTPNIFNKKYQLLAPAFCFWLNLTSWIFFLNQSDKYVFFFGFSSRQNCNFFFGKYCQISLLGSLACNQECE
jgi:hypothetical protein